MKMKSLDQKLINLRSNPAAEDFILVDAKDPDSAFGILGTGMKNSGENRSKQEFFEDIQALVDQAIVDVMLSSINTYDRLTCKEDIFASSTVTPAIRMNSSTDIWMVRKGNYSQKKSIPFTCVDVRRTMIGHPPPWENEKTNIDLGLYSVTFNNHPEDDLRTFEAFKSFWIEAEQCHFRYFLEVFDPNASDCGLKPDEIPSFVNDQIARILSITPLAASPLFLKLPYHGPKAMQELAQFDKDLLIGILGGSSGTTYDSFKLIAEAQKYGARAAIFGRRIKDSEDPPTFVKFLDQIVKKKISPERAVEEYHAEIEKAGIEPRRTLKEDSKISSEALKYLL
jgi:hypothetical protein